MLFPPSLQYFCLSTLLVLYPWKFLTLIFLVLGWLVYLVLQTSSREFTFCKRLPRLQYSLIDNFTTHSSATACFLFRSEAKRTRHARRKSYEMRKKRPGTNVQRSGNDNSGKAEERIVLATVSNKLRGRTARRHYCHFSFSLFRSCEEIMQLLARTYYSSYIFLFKEQFLRNFELIFTFVYYKNSSLLFLCQMRRLSLSACLKETFYSLRSNCTPADVSIFYRSLEPVIM